MNCHLSHSAHALKHHTSFFPCPFHTFKAVCIFCGSLKIVFYDLEHWCTVFRHCSWVGGWGGVCRMECRREGHIGSVAEINFVGEVSSLVTPSGSSSSWHEMLHLPWDMVSLVLWSNVGSFLGFYNNYPNFPSILGPLDLVSVIHTWMSCNE